jgi:alpha-L-fucosidase 2
MLYELLFKAFSSDGTVSCSPADSNATLSVSGGSDSWVAWVGDTEYSLDAGNAESGYSFKGEDPHDSLVESISALSSSYNDVLAEHLDDYHAVLTDKFSLDIGQTPDFDNPTNVVKESYQLDEGNPYIEWLTFNLGRYLLAGSARGKLPANLQGKWANGYGSAWSAGTIFDVAFQRRL